MKTERTVIIPWLLSASLALAQTFIPRAGPDPALGQAEYDRFCPSQHGTIKTLSPSSSVVVHCDAIPQLPVLGNREWTASMEDCGLWCETKGNNCMASFWDPSNGACHWSRAQAVEPRNKYVTLVRMTPLDSCEKAKEKCLKDNAAFSRAEEECKDRETSLKRALEARDRKLARFRERTPCNDVHGQSRIVGDKIFKLRCNHNHKPHHYTKFVSTNWWDCVQACANDKRCVAGDWYSWRFEGNPPNTCFLHNTGAHSGFMPKSGVNSWELID